jgi:excisionase family DNA binding protein
MGSPIEDWLAAVPVPEPVGWWRALTLRQAAGAAGEPEPVILSAIEADELRGLRHGGQVRVVESSLWEWVARGSPAPDPPPAGPAPAKPKKAPPGPVVVPDGPPDQELSVREVVALTGLAENTVYSGIHKGRIPAVRVDGRLVVKRSDAEAYRDRVRGGAAA